MKLFLHIGTEKTGTTTIQGLLNTNRELLISNDLYFIRSAGESNNRALPSVCMNGLDDFFYYNGISDEQGKKSFTNNFLKEFDTELRNIPKNIKAVIISSEHFHSRLKTIEEIENVRRILCKYFDEITIICYLRDQINVCNSLFSTAIKAGHFSSFGDLLKGCNSSNNYYNYHKLINMWCTVFYDAKFVIRKFERKSLVNQNLIDDFFTLIDHNIMDALDRNVLDENTSITAEGLFIGKALNKSLKLIPSNELYETDRVKLINFIYSRYKGKSINYSKEQSEKIYNEFLQSNRDLNLQFFGCDEDLFSTHFDLKSVENSDYDFQKLSEVFSEIFKTKIKLPDDIINSIRDIAIEFEHKNIKVSQFLMELALKTRPNGQFIKNKLDQYNEKIKLLSKVEK